jgi:DNA primase
MDIQTIKESTDCRHLIERDLGRPHGSTTGKSLQWHCPLHNETKGYSLTVWADGWKCWGKCAIEGDAIKWLEVYHGLSFLEACQVLNGGQPVVSKKGRRSGIATPKPQSEKSEPPDPEWQAMARTIIGQAHTFLCSKQGGKAFAYLRGRGLQPQIIHEAQLGYIPGHYTAYKNCRLPSGARFDVPCGILIPWLIDGEVWGIKVRRAAGSIKYVQVKGSRISGQALYWSDNLINNFPVLFVEGEFDCLIAWQEAADLASPVTLGAASNRLDPRWFGAVGACSKVLLSYDGDQAGAKGAAHLGELAKFARRLPLTTKDVSDYHKLYPMRGVYEWLERHI